MLRIFIEKTMLIVIVCLCITACQKFNADIQNNAESKISTPQATRKDFEERWKEGVNKLTQNRHNQKEVEGEDGIKSFLVCEKIINNKCSYDKTIGVAEVKYDGFRKIYIFDPATLSNDNLDNALDDKTMYIYFSLPEYKNPITFMRVIYESKNWLFLNRIQIMSEGNVVLDKEIAENAIERRVDVNGIIEDAHIILNDADMDAIKSIKDSKYLVRLSGKKSFDAIPKSSLEFIYAEVKSSIYWYDKIKELVPRE